MNTWKYTDDDFTPEELAQTQRWIKESKADLEAIADMEIVEALKQIKNPTSQKGENQ